MLSGVHACITDPPYHLKEMTKRFGKPDSAACGKGTDGRFQRLSKGFMGQAWDGGDVAFRKETWASVYNALLPGAHCVAFGGTRTYHRMASAIEDAGFDIRDMLAWLYGTGFPKSHDVSKAIDRAANASRAQVRTKASANQMAQGIGVRRPWMEAAQARGFHEHAGPDAVTEAGKQWQGWGTALKPAHEPICLARRPLIGSHAQNVVTFGTGCINIDVSRVGAREKAKVTDPKRTGVVYGKINIGGGKLLPDARWPANVVHDDSAEVRGWFPGAVESPARFYYSAKASTAEREAGLGEGAGRANMHPTVKPVALMRWLCGLVTSPGGAIVDPFMGAGSTGIAAMLGGFSFVGIEQSPEYFELACARIRAAAENPGLFTSRNPAKDEREAWQTATS
jgi:DNA modification methylase